MKLLTMVTLLAGSAFVSLADSGGPYEGVPDCKEEEKPPVFQIPKTKEPLRYYLKHIPKLKWNQELSEPDSYTWDKIVTYHASFRVLGHVRGRELYEVRYVSDSRIDQGLDFADTILILARGFDTGSDQQLLEVIYYSSGAGSFDRRAEHFPEGDKYGAVKITDWWSGTGPGRWRSVYLKGTEDFAYQRFTPDQPKTEDGSDQPATAPESKPESNQNPKPESKVRPQ